MGVIVNWAITPLIKKNIVPSSNWLGYHADNVDIWVQIPLELQKI